MKNNISLNRSNELLFNFIDYLFWILLILFTNPGGILETINKGYAFGRVMLDDIIFFLLSICYVIIPKEYDVFDNAFIKVKKLLIIFLVYYFIVFCYLVPILNGNNGYSLSITLIKSRWFLYHVLLAIYIYEYFKRSWDLFLKLFLYSSIIILVIFLQSLISKISILPVALMNRGFVNLERNLMVSYGLMPLLIPLGTTVLVFRSKVKYRNLILIGYILMSIAWLVSITRRHILEIFLYFIIALLYYFLINKNFSVILNKTLKISFIVFSLALITFISLPQYTSSAWVGIEESVSIFSHNKDLEGHKDVRMTLDKPFINEQFYNNPFLGTGFDNRWRTKSGDNQGYEASDYPFLASLAMFGIFGVIVFLPVYIILIKIMKMDFQFLKTKLQTKNDILFSVFLAFILYFTFNFLQYFNYFESISVSSNFIWYFSLSLYLGSRSQLYKTELVKNNLQKVPGEENEQKGNYNYFKF